MVQNLQWLSFSGHYQEQSIMARMGIDSGTTNIFDEVDKSDFKTDFGSEFPVGSTFYSYWHVTHPLPPNLSLSFVFCPMYQNDLCTCDVSVILPCSTLSYSDHLLQLYDLTSSSALVTLSLLPIITCFSS